MELATSLGLNTEEDLKLDFEPGAPLCRGCLTTDRKLVIASVYEDLFKEFTGISIQESDALPQWLCHECVALLHKCYKFKCKMLRAHNTLYQYVSRCAPFAIDATDEELAKHASPHLSRNNILTYELSGKGRSEACEVLVHEYQSSNSEYSEIDLLPVNKIELDIVKNEELGFSDYEDNITLDEFRTSSNKITEDDLESLLRETDHIEVLEPEVKKKRKTKKKDTKSKMSKNTEDITDENTSKTKSSSSIRKTVELDPTKIRIVYLNPEEQIKHREEESQASLKSFQCKLCFKGFNFESKLQNHMSKHDPSRGTFECKLCQMYLPTAYSYRVHSFIHTRRYECVVCGRRMIDKTSIVDHYRTQHEGMLTLFTCNICGKVSNNNKTHRGHMRNHHSGERPKCDQCGKSFVNKDSLTEHLQIHQGVKNYECSLCGKKFRTRTQINNHQLKHSDVKEYYCVECDVRFKSAYSLRQHLRKSLKHKDKGSLIFACTTCDKRYETVQALSHHTRIQHEGERAHPCTTCGAALASRSSLLKHTLAVHAGKRAPPRHVCHTCGKAFRGKSVLTNHVRTHTGEKPFSCAVCGKSFSQRTAMLTHVKLVHLKIKRTNKIKPEQLSEAMPQSPKLEVFKPEAPLEPWRQPCDVYFHVTAGP